MQLFKIIGFAALLDSGASEATTTILGLNDGFSFSGSGK